MTALLPAVRAAARAARPWLGPALHVAAGAVVLAGIAATVWRPFAPPAGPLPPAGDWFDPAYLARAQAYQTPRRVASLAVLALGVAVPLAIALTPAGRRATGRVLALTGPRHPVLGAAAVGGAVLLATDLAQLPLAFWAGYVHDGAFGFRTHGLGGWTLDWLLSGAPYWLGGALVAAGAVALGRRCGPGTWPAVAGLGGAAVVALMVLAGPLLLEPLQFRTTPLPEGPTRDAVEAVLARAGANVRAIVVADASRRTTKENAYVSGLGATRRVVLYDTLVRNRTPEETAAVFAHELGHQRNGDLPRGVALGGATMVAGSYGLAWLLRRRHGSGALGDPRRLPEALAVVALATVLTLPVQSVVSRAVESAADEASLQLTGDVTAYLALQEGLTRANLAEPQPPAWATFLWATHPSPLERLARGLGSEHARPDADPE